MDDFKPQKADRKLMRRIKASQKERLLLSLKVHFKLNNK
jgi:hypothetical protein